MPSALKSGTELSGRTVFGELTVLRIERDPARKRRHYALCLCSCGIKKFIRIDHLRTGKTVSCGHISRIRSSERAKTNLTPTITKHGKSKSRIYIIWCGMHQRCRNPKNAAFKHYGGRGIFVCDPWSEFENFLIDMGEPPNGHTLERIDNDGPYSPENCRWATRAEQMNNTRNNHILSIGNQTKTIAQWADECGLNYTTLAGRLDAGWSAEDAVKPGLYRNFTGLVLGGKANGARLKARTHCKNGHPFDEENTFFNGKQRICRTCKRDSEARRRAR